MMIHLALLSPNEGHEQALLDSMRAMGEPADGHPGLRQHFVCRDPGSGRFVGITVWDREGDWAEAIAAGRQAQADGGFDMDSILAGGDAMRLEVIDVVDRVGGVERRGQLST